MKNDKTNLFISKLLTTLLAWQMIFAPTIFAGNLTGDDNLQAQKEACTGSSVEWNDKLNSCTVKAAAEETKANSEACANSDNPDVCYLSNAEALSGVEAGDDIDTSNLEMVGKVVAAVYFAFGIIAGGSFLDGVNDRVKKTKPKCMSGRLFQYTSVAWIGGDFFLRRSAKKNFEKIAKKYEEEAKNDELKGSKEGSYQAQVRAFEYLKEEQENVKKQAKSRKLLQMAIIAGYTASMGFGIAEQMGSATRCIKKDQAQEKEKPEEVKPDKLDQNGKPLNEPKVAEVDSKDVDVDKDKVTIEQDPKTVETQQATLGAGAAQMAKTMYGGIKKNLGTSLGNTIASGVMLGLNGYLIYHASNEQKKADKNIEAIDKVIDSYSAYMSGFCPDGRDDVSDPECYCYNSDGTQNENRTNSVICQNLYASRGIDYGAQTAKEKINAPRQGCVRVTGQFDEDCRCANMTNTTTGQNACAKVSSITTNTNGFTSALAVPDAISTGNKLNGGASTALANMNTASLAASAAKNKRFTDKLLDSAKKNGMNLPTTKQLNHTLAKQLRSIASEIPSSAKLSSSGLSASAATMPASVRKALEEAKNDERSSAAAGALLSSLSNGGGSIGGRKANANTFVWNDSASGSGGKVQTFMNKKYKYKNSDIVNRKDVSLWNVISRRYQTSGIKRLFEDEDE